MLSAILISVETSAYIGTDILRAVTDNPEMAEPKWKIMKIDNNVSENGMITLAYYSRNTKTISIRPDLKKEIIKHVMYHEYAHYYYYNKLDELSRELYCDVFEKYPISPSYYGFTSCEENFAEMYALYKYNSVSPDAYQGAINLLDHTVHYQFFKKYTNAKPINRHDSTVKYEK